MCSKKGGGSVKNQKQLWQRNDILSRRHEFVCVSWFVHQKITFPSPNQTIFSYATFFGAGVVFHKKVVGWLRTKNILDKKMILFLGGMNLFV